jgi:prepilin-type N-terminal cleavage/methylation domain-containing protein
VRKTRQAYTLMEVVLVLALVVILASMAWPVIDAMQAGPRLTAGTDTVRSAWSKARTRAVEERRAYRFAVKDNSGTFRVAPDTPEFWGDSEGMDDGLNADALVYENSLPDRVVFVPNSESGGEGQASDDWRTVVTFLPDGSASEDAELCLRTSGTSPTTLKLNGSTCAVSTASLASVVNAH